MSIKYIEPGPRMSQAVVSNGVAYLAGQVSQKCGGQSAANQTRDILEQIDTLLSEVGSDRKRILSTTIYLSDIADFAEMNAVWDEWVPQGHTPARATVEAKLALPKFTVEIVVVAACD